MEVFAALYNYEGTIICEPAAIVLTTDFLAEKLNHTKIIFSGSGSDKWNQLIQHPNAIFSKVQHNATHLATIAHIYFKLKKYSNLAYTEPFYLKAFYLP
jgi:tRNA threonylcarbamoyladenosine biosynthesis protein TsaB